MTVTLKFDDQKERLKGMIQKHIKSGSFELKSGKYNNKYFDIKSLFCNGSFGLYVAKAIELSDDIKYVGGMEFGSIQFATALSISYGYMPSFIVRKQTKIHGLGGRVISYVSPMVGKCCIVDDVITTGSSVEDCIEGLKLDGHQLEIDSIIAVIDRTNGEYKKFPIYSFFKEEDFDGTIN